MKYSIQQVSETTWELRNAGERVGDPYEDRPGQTGYDQACARLGQLLAEHKLATTDSTDDGTGSPDGLLPERWVSDEGLCFPEDTPGGRDFSECEFSWRDPGVSLVPLMLQTESDYGHQGAELAGYFEEFHMESGIPSGSGRFYDNDAGVQFRDLLLGGRRFGVSVDPTENVTVEYREECLSTDEQGFCVEYDFSVVFLTYEIGGVTGCPFPCFERASIILDTSADTGAAVRASASIPVKPPKSWLTLAEPKPGMPWFDGQSGDDVLVEQRDRAGNVAGLACPLTMRDDGLVYGHLTYFGQCHVADPWGPGVCASATASRNGYADFLTGVTVCDDGTQVPTGVLTVGCEHSSALDVAGVRDHLAHAGVGWASVNVVDGELGPWLCGVLRPDLTDQQIRVLRSLSLSGEWVGELAGILAVNKAGLPVQRALAAAASFGPGRTIPAAVLRSSASGGALTKLIGGNIIGHCPECEKRRLAAASASSFTAEDRALLHRMAIRVDVIDRRTVGLIDASAEAVRASFGA